MNDHRLSSSTKIKSFTDSTVIGASKFGIKRKRVSFSEQTQSIPHPDSITDNDTNFKSSSTPSINKSTSMNNIDHNFELEYDYSSSINFNNNKTTTTTAAANLSPNLHSQSQPTELLQLFSSQSSGSKRSNNSRRSNTSVGEFTVDQHHNLQSRKQYQSPPPLQQQNQDQFKWMSEDSDDYLESYGVDARVGHIKTTGHNFDSVTQENQNQNQNQDQHQQSTLPPLKPSSTTIKKKTTLVKSTSSIINLTNPTNPTNLTNLTNLLHPLDDLLLNLPPFESECQQYEDDFTNTMDCDCLIFKKSKPNISNLNDNRIKLGSTVLIEETPTSQLQSRLSPNPQSSQFSQQSSPQQPSNNTKKINHGDLISFTNDKGIIQSTTMLDDSMLDDSTYDALLLEFSSTQSSALLSPSSAMCTPPFVFSALEQQQQQQPLSDKKPTHQDTAFLLSASHQLQTATSQLRSTFIPPLYNTASTYISPLIENLHNPAVEALSQSQQNSSSSSTQDSDSENSNVINTFNNVRSTPLLSNNPSLSRSQQVGGLSLNRSKLNTFTPNNNQSKFYPNRSKLNTFTPNNNQSKFYPEFKTTLPFQSKSMIPNLQHQSRQPQFQHLDNDENKQLITPNHQQQSIDLSKYTTQSSHLSSLIPFFVNNSQLDYNLNTMMSTTSPQIHGEINRP
jgi:hypothetical protein